MMTALALLFLLEMRYSEQTISFTNPKNNKTTFQTLRRLRIDSFKVSSATARQDDRGHLSNFATDNGIL